MGILSTEKVTKYFGGLQAVKDIDIDIPEGVIYSIIGPNGAGKTTFFNCLTGFYTPEIGEIFFKDEMICKYPPHKISNLGISRTYQNIRLFNNLTTIENILAGQNGLLQTTLFDAVLQTKKFCSEETEALDRAHDVLDFMGLVKTGDTLARNLSYGQQRRLEIARAIAGKPSFLLLDEPTAGMNMSETEEMIGLIRKLRDDLGITILLIEHDISLVMKISEKVIVFDFGENIAEGKPEEIQRNQQVIEAYLGKNSSVSQ